MPLLGLGLLFFLIKRTESCTLTVADGPTGALVTVGGRMATHDLERVRSWLVDPGAVSVVDEGSMPAAASEPDAPTPEPDAPTPLPVPRPIATAVPDDAGHTAARPGRSIPQPRVRFDDGHTVPVDPAIFVGRDPALPDSHSVGSAALVRVPAPCMSVSKTHLAVRFIDGCLWVEDLHSTNGTSVRSVTGEQVPVPPGSPVPLAVGSVVQLGERTFEVVAE